MWLDTQDASSWDWNPADFTSVRYLTPKLSFFSALVKGFFYVYIYLHIHLSYIYIYIYNRLRYEWLNKTLIYKLINFYFFKLSENLLKNRSYKLFSCKKNNINQSMNILKEKVKIHAWNVAVLFGLNLNGYIFLCVKDLCVSISLCKRENVFMH